MARTKGGMFGPANGKIGRIVFYDLNGQPVARINGQKPPVTAAVTLGQNSRMSVLMAFFRMVKPFIKVGFKNEAAGTVRHYHNLATSYNMVPGMTETDGIASLKYDGLLLSRGTGLVAQNPQVVPDDTGITFSWDTNPELPWQTKQDQAMMLAWFPELGEAIYNIAGVIRRAGSGHLNLPASFRARRMETYIAFAAEDRGSVSNSLYVGRIN